MAECRKLGTVKHGPACGCPDGHCVLDIHDGQWPYDSSIEDTLDNNLEGERPLAAWTLVKPGLKVHQRVFSVANIRVVADHYELVWQAEKDKALKTLLEDNGFHLTFDTYSEEASDAVFGRWTLEETTA